MEKQGIVFLMSLAFATAAVAQEVIVGRQEPAAAVEAAWSPAMAGPLAKATHKNKRVLVVFERADCDASKQLAEACKKERELSRKILYEYEVVRLDVATPEGGATMKRLGIASLPESGTPFLAVLDAQGKQVASLESTAFVAEGRTDAKKLVTELERWQASPQNASALLAAALASAKETGRRVFVHFDAPW